MSQFNTSTAAGCAAVLEPRQAQVARRLGALGRTLPEPLARQAERVSTASEFVLAALEQETDALIAALSRPGGADAEPAPGLPVVLDGSEAEAMARLRRYRRIEMARIAWRDIAGTGTLDESLRDLSGLADAAIRLALDCAMRNLEPRYGTPRTVGGRVAPLLVLGMGKLGGNELNFSSDIDLVFAYPDDVTLDGAASVEPERYYRRVAQTLIKLLNEQTVDGFVFRVDARLRPFGASGPLAVSLSALEAYLVQHGRDWERYAYVKARLVTGLEFEREVFGQILTPFVYRRYLDYGMFDSLRQMKLLIDREVARKEMQRNIKLGSGGIREIEFIAQVLQIIRGGQDARLRGRRLLAVLPKLAELGVLGDDEVGRLVDAYRYLRVVENRLQALDDKQTHELPDDPETRARLTLAMDAPDWSALEADVDAMRREVARQFGGIAWPTVPASATGADRSIDAWAVGDVRALLAETALGDDPELAALLTALRDGGLYRRMDEPSRQRLAGVITRLLPLLEGRAQPAAVFGRILPVLEAICRRSAYLALLIENPTALSRLLDVAGGSPVLARQICEHPALLDELLDARLFDSPPSRAELSHSLSQYLEAAAGDDAESYVYAIRQFQRAAVFRIAVADRLGGLPLMQVSDRLTDTAELVLQSALEIARRELEAVHGGPMHGDAGALRPSQFAIVAYGKLGGLELGYGSDLDLVFLHDSEGPVQQTEGPKHVDNQRFFARLVQRLIHFLTIQTTSGRLYEIDTRLRPSGASGAMVASLASFRRYQREQAWTWEHQALLRSRAVAGDAELRRTFESERREILIEHVDRERLEFEVARMRARMRKELSVSHSGEFDVKQDAGGLADIEFLIDYRVLRDAPAYPALVEYPDNVRQLEALEAAGLMPATDCARLKRIYLAYRSRAHELALADGGKVVPDTEFVAEREAVVRYWQAALGEAGAAVESDGGR